MESSQDKSRVKTLILFQNDEQSNYLPKHWYRR